MIEYIKFGNRLDSFWSIFSLCNIMWNYKKFTNVFFNNLISILKWDFFGKILLFEFWTTLFQIPFTKNPFNISLVEVQKHVISKNSICDNNL
jgi:hypothetical protein